MEFASTRKKSPIVCFEDALFKGLAPDGGLYHPREMRDFKDLFAAFSPDTSFKEIGRRVTSAVLGPEIDEELSTRITDKAFTFSPALTRMTDRISILELFHGPTYAFKDFGACFMASAMEEFLLKEGRQITILVATSGDTGSAVAKAFHGKHNINVVILYPSGRVSFLQEKQLTTLGGNVTALEVKGAFDDCQRMVKEAFCDPDLSAKINLSSANSINIGRLFPQALYYIYGFSQLADNKDDVYFCVPSGNFGNLTAGVYAWKWGLGIKGFVAATNVNDVVPTYLVSKDYSPRSSIHTLSNAMDVGNPSNFERLQEIFDNDWQAMKDAIHPEVVTDSETIATISRIYTTHHSFIDPHTAVGYLATERYLEKHKHNKTQVIVLSTAHPAKFTETVKEATGAEPPLPGPLKAALALPKQSIVIGNTMADLKDYLLKGAD